MDIAHSCFEHELTRHFELVKQVVWDNFNDHSHLIHKDYKSNCCLKKNSTSVWHCWSYTIAQIFPYFAFAFLLYVLLCTNHALLVRLQALHSNSSNTNNDGGSLLSALTKSTPEVSSTIYCNDLKEVATICFHLPFITLLPYTTLHTIILPILIIIKAKPTMASNLVLV